MLKATGSMSDLTIMFAIIAVLLVLGVGGLCLALFGKARWRPGYRIEVGFIALLVGLGFYADQRSARVFAAYEAGLPQESLTGTNWKATFQKLKKQGIDRVIRVYAFQWGFTFIDEKSAASRNAVMVKPGEKILFALMSNDVIHGFNIPVARVISEFEPPGVRTVWIRAPKKPGKYLIQCTNYCGLGHAQMKAWLVVSGTGTGTGAGAGAKPAAKHE